jgi:hypothetical protein
MMLHLTFHVGCANVIQQIFTGIVTKLVTSGKDGYYYNMTPVRSDQLWEKEKDYFNSFDTIIVSDTIPLARPLLDNYDGNVILYISNRFDYGDTKDPAAFPDEDYYRIMNTYRPNVKVIANNYFDKWYAEERGVTVGDVIKSTTPPHPKIRKERYYVPVYWNDNLFELATKCSHLNPLTGRYGDGQLDTFRAIVHIPYTWSSISLYDALAAGVPYYIPSIKFLLKLFPIENFWFQNANYLKKYWSLCEFYRKENSKFVFYFDSFEDIKPINPDPAVIYTYAEELYQINQDKWRRILTF